MLVNVGKGIEREIDFTSIPQTAIDHILYIGARNILMDSHASITTEEFPEAEARRAAAEAMVDKKLEALLAGIVRVSTSRESVDPVRAEALRMANAIVTAKVRAAGKKVKDYEPAAIKAAAAKLVTPELLAQAAARVAETKAATPDTDLSALGL